VEVKALLKEGCAWKPRAEMVTELRGTLMEAIRPTAGEGGGGSGFRRSQKCFEGSASAPHCAFCQTEGRSPCRGRVVAQGQHTARTEEEDSHNDRSSINLFHRAIMASYRAQEEPLRNEHLSSHPAAPPRPLAGERRARSDPKNPRPKVCRRKTE